MKGIKIKTLLFDIGGVLVEYIGVNRMIELTGEKITPDEFGERWIKSKYLKQYEIGGCDAETFAEGAVKEFGMDISPGDFIRAFPFFAKGFYPGAEELLRAVRPKYTLACLSNTNVLQWNSMRDRFSIDKYFHYNFLSFETGVLKPDPEAYAYVIKKLGCGPDEIAFFDDNEANIQAGINAGIKAYRVLDFNDLKDNLQTLNLL